MRRSICMLVLCLVAAVAVGCGGGDDKKPGPADAEKTVHDYLAALVAKDGAGACGKLTPEYQKSVLQQNDAFAKSQKADTCTKLIDAITRSAPSVSFEGEILNKDNVGDVGLEVSVRDSGDQQNATVTGKQGIQRYELETRDGKWLISKIERNDKPAGD
jgi:hypothetical protein